MSGMGLVTPRAKLSHGSRAWGYLRLVLAAEVGTLKPRPPRSSVQPELSWTGRVPSPVGMAWSSAISWAAFLLAYGSQAQ